MVLRFVDRARMTVAVGGTGNLTLGSAIAKYDSFAGAGIVDGDTFCYVIDDGTAWEYGIGTYVASGTSVVRTTRLKSSTGAALNVSTSAVVFVGMLGSVMESIRNYAEAALPKTGGTMSGNIVLAGDPSLQLHPVTKQYADNSIASLWMEIARLSGSGVDFINGWSDSYDDFGRVDAANSVNEYLGVPGSISSAPVYGSNIIPAMTAATTSGVTMSASSQFDGSSTAWRAGDRSTSTNWGSVASGLPGWLKVDFGTAKTVSQFSMQARSGANNIQAPTTFQLQGSNDDSAWDTIQSYTTPSWAASEIRSFDVVTPAAYRYYRIYITAVGSGTAIGILEVTMFETASWSNADVRFFGQSIGSVPSVADVYALVEAFSGLTWGTDLKAYATRNNGAGWVEGTITEVGKVGALSLIQASAIALGATASGVLLAPRFVTANGKRFKLHAHTIVGRA